jgi:hypothetical protein
MLRVYGAKALQHGTAKRRCGAVGRCKDHGSPSDDRLLVRNGNRRSSLERREGCSKCDEPRRCDEDEIWSAVLYQRNEILRTAANSRRSAGVLRSSSLKGRTASP